MSPAQVAITHSLDIEQAMSEALKAIPQLPALVRGKVVAVKPNETWALPSDTNGVTQPDTLRAVLRYVKQHAPQSLIVSGGAGAAETDDVFRIAGLMEVIEEEGVEFFDHNRPPFQEVSLDYGSHPETAGMQQSVMVNPRILEYETVISLAQHKLHATATVTLAMKNIAMSFPAADYYGHPRSSETHEHAFYDDMHSFIAAMIKRFPIDLAIIVGHPTMLATGPIGGLPVETGMVIASTDAVAADAVGAKLFGFTSQAVRHIWEAGKLGLGETMVEDFVYPKLDIKAAIRRFTKAAYGKELEF